MEVSNQYYWYNFKDKKIKASQTLRETHEQENHQL